MNRKSMRAKLKRNECAYYVRRCRHRRTSLNTPNSTMDDDLFWSLVSRCHPFHLILLWPYGAFDKYNITRNIDHLDGLILPDSCIDKNKQQDHHHDD